MEGTETHVAKQRIALVCSLAAGHAGPHRDGSQQQEWRVVEGRPSIAFRDEDEDVSAR